MTMNVFIDNLPVKLPSDHMTVADLVAWKGLKPIATTVAVNDIIVRRDKWQIVRLNDFDRVTIVSFHI